MSSVLLVVEPSKMTLYNILYPKRRIESYSILGTIVSRNKNTTQITPIESQFPFHFPWFFQLILHYRALNPVIGTIITPNNPKP